MTEPNTKKRTAPPTGGKLMHLEGLRGIAAYGVFLVHFLDGGFCSDAHQFCRDIPHLGQNFNVYVALFFILSGRVLCASVLRIALANGPSVPIFKQLGTSILKRPMRLGLPLVAVTILQTIRGRGNEGPWSIIQILLAPLYFIFFNLGLQANPIPGVGWTMAHELLGSFVVYGLTMLLLTVSSTRGRTVILFTSFVFASFGHSWTAHFILGLIFAFAAEEKWFAILKRKSKLVYLFKWALVFLTFILFFESPISVGGQVRRFLTSYQLNVENGHLGVAENVFWQENIAIMCIAAVMMLMVETTEIIQYLLSTTLPVYLARISFMMYLTHEMLYVSTRGYWISFYARDDHVSRGVHFIIVNICLFITSDFFTMTIDQPSLDLTNFVAKTVLSDTWTMQQVWDSIPFWPRYILNYLLYILQNIGRTYYGYFFSLAPQEKKVEYQKLETVVDNSDVSDTSTDVDDPIVLDLESGKQHEL